MRAWVVTCTSLVGLGVVYPLLPYQAVALGASVQIVTALLAVDTFVILFVAPLLGFLSDRIGRKPVVVFGLIFSPLAYVLGAEADALWMLFASRAIAGVGIATTSVIQAYVADQGPSGQRAVGMASINACFGVAFVVGPLIATLALGSTGSDYRSAGYCAAAFSAASLPLAASWLHSHAPFRLGREPGLRFSLALVRTARVAIPMGVMAILAFAYAEMDATIGIWSARVIAWQARDLAFAFALAGAGTVVSVIVVRHLAAILGERALAQGAAFALSASLIALVVIPSPTTVFIAIFVMGGSLATSLSCLQSLVADAAPAHLRGAVLGLCHAMASVARTAGPVWGGFCYENLGADWPYATGAVLAAGGMALLIRHPTSSHIPSFVQRRMESFGVQRRLLSRRERTALSQ